MARDNVDLIEGAWAAWAKGDVEAATAIVAPEGEIHAPESLPWGGTYIGPEGFQAMLGALVASFSQIKSTPTKVLGADDDHVIVLAETMLAPLDETERETLRLLLRKLAGVQ